MARRRAVGVEPWRMPAAERAMERAAKRQSPSASSTEAGWRGTAALERAQERSSKVPSAGGKASIALHGGGTVGAARAEAWPRLGLTARAPEGAPRRWRGSDVAEGAPGERVRRRAPPTNGVGGTAGGGEGGGACGSEGEGGGGGDGSSWSAGRVTWHRPRTSPGRWSWRTRTHTSQPVGLRYGGRATVARELGKEAMVTRVLGIGGDGGGGGGGGGGR